MITKGIYIGIACWGFSMLIIPTELLWQMFTILGCFSWLGLCVFFWWWKLDKGEYFGD